MNKELLKKNFEAHGFTTQFFDTKEEATQYLTDTIKGKTIGSGGSVTLADMKLWDKLGENNTLYVHSIAPGTESEALTADIFISSANGISETGEIVNIDGRGNRVAGTLSGHEKVYFVVGRNKITPDVASAISRSRDVAAPPNCARLGKKTPCAINKDKCYDCNSPDRICRALVVLERCLSRTAMEVIFIDEDLGF